MLLISSFLKLSSSLVNSYTYYLSWAIYCELGSLLTMGLFLMFLALLAYFSVFSVSSKLISAGEMHAIMIVLLLPPSESYRIRVSLESLYGTCPLFFSSVNADITLPKERRPLLMLMPSLSVAPVAPVLLALSLPAKSTK